MSTQSQRITSHKQFRKKYLIQVIEIYEEKQGKLCAPLGSQYNPIKIVCIVLKYYEKDRLFTFIYFKFVLDGDVWIKLLTYNQIIFSPPLGELIDKKFQDKFIDIATIIQLTKNGERYWFSNSWHNFSTKQSWILRDFTIGQHTNSTLSISGKTPTGYEWDQNIPDGFMQISGNFDTFGDKDQRQINFCNQEPLYIQRNSLVTVQIGAKNNEKDGLGQNSKQDNDLLQIIEKNNYTSQTIAG
ncbi:hypothetical protein pb186bvf_014913 [Paramecium bursaria]